jgi:rSAM/selenodomain-associated transferase 2
MISVIIPTLNAEKTLAATLEALVPAAVDGLVREVIIVDGGSRDRTRDVVDQAGADLIVSAPGRGRQLAAGAAMAKSPWLLFLHADTCLAYDWDREAVGFMRAIDNGHRSPAAAAFRFKLDDQGFAPRTLEALVRLRCFVLRLPYGDQGLLISKALFSEVGGFKDIPIMEDVDLIRRLGRRRVAMLNCLATTSADRYKADGYFARALRNQMCLALYRVGLPVDRIVRLYSKADVGT